ncbi:MAG: M20/M25/M40 family metallo-hydrolase [Anaerolineae bacterium]|nr:M20/M25/M40 family metallo-hydrolase [Anaerolineae bacterium]
MKRALGQIVFALLMAGQFAGLFGAQSMVSASPALTLVPLNSANSTAAFSEWVNQIDSVRLMEHVSALTHCGSRHVSSGNEGADWGIGVARRYIHGQFSAMAQSSAAVVETQEFFAPWSGVQSALYNEIATLPGTDPTAGAIVIGAHYDSLNLQNQNGSAPGANDNASGVAAVLELARVLSARPHRATLVFVAFSGEEIGREGSIAFVRDYVPAHTLDIRAMINLDVIGGSVSEQGAVNDTEIRLFSAAEDNSASRQLARSLQAYSGFYGAELRVLMQDRLDRVGRYGDHQSFSDAGYPAVRFISVMENPWHQHTVMDTMDDIDPAYLQRAARTVLTVTLALADGLPSPLEATIAQADGSTSLTWQPVADAQSYVIAIHPAGSLTYDALYEVSADALSATWTALELSNVAGAAVAARDAAGQIGLFSPEQRLT